MNNLNSLRNCDKNVTGTNLLLAQLLLRTTDDTTNISDNPALLSIVQSLSKTSELYYSRPTPLQWNLDSNTHARAVSDSSTSSTCNSSLSLPSSVHVADVTHDQCIAQEHPASHGVSGTANETNVTCSVNSDGHEGMSSASSPSKESSRKRPPGTMTESTPTYYPSKRPTRMDRNDIGFHEAITDIDVLGKYIKNTYNDERHVMDDYHNSTNTTPQDIFKYVTRLMNRANRRSYLTCIIHLSF